jgi:hypothetical protein
MRGMPDQISEKALKWRVDCISVEFRTVVMYINVQKEVLYALNRFYEIPQECGSVS